jgi:trk system potassium uptake protein TrkA
MRVIIVGAGNVGYNLARVLSEKLDIVLIEKDERACENVREQLDVAVVCGNGANVNILKSLLTDDTRLFIAVTDNDELNLVACMAAKQLNEKVKTIARVSNPDYIDKPISSRRFLGVDVMISPELSLADKIVRIVGLPPAIDYEEVCIPYGGDCILLSIVKFRIGSSFPARTFLRELDFPRGAILIAIDRNGKLITPKGNEILKENDKVLVLGKPEVMGEIAEFFGSEKESGDIFIVGGGIVGLYIAKLLDKEVGGRIKIVEKNAERCRLLSEEVPNHIIINADATDLNVLEDEGLERASVMISVTDSDEKNLLCSLAAKHIGVPKVISRVSKYEYRDIFEVLGVDVPLSLHQIMVNEVVKFVWGKYIKAVLNLLDSTKEVLELPITRNSKVNGKKLKELKLPEDTLVVAILRNGTIEIPRGESILLGGDAVIVLSPLKDVDRVEKLFGCPAGELCE